MPRIKSQQSKCQLGSCGKMFYRWNGNVNQKYCSKKCSCKSKHTPEFQSRAGKIGALRQIEKRGTGTKGYIKYFNRHEHRVVAEKMLGRKLKKGEIVHHKDGNKHNNSPSNLEVMTQSQHAKLHWKEWREKTIHEFRNNNN